MTEKIDFTRQEAEQLFQIAVDEYDYVRIVDPVERIVKKTFGDTPGEGTYCHSIWSRCERCENCTSLRALTAKHTTYKMEFCNGHTFWIKSRYLRIDGTETVGEFVSDVSESLLVESDKSDEVGVIISSFNEKLILDTLTEVYNRRYLTEHFLPRLQYLQPEEVRVNIAVMDLDKFKYINDTYGHYAGDILLKDVAGFWKGLFHSREPGAERIVIRYGGDEFLILDRTKTFRKFSEDLDREYDSMRKTCFVDHTIAFPFSISFGTASSEELGADYRWETLFELADKRLYAKKKERGSTR